MNDIKTEMRGGYRLESGPNTQENPDVENQLLVSIITVVYNGAAFLELTINSVLSQTYSNIEYIIIDGGSTDGTIDIIRKYENKIAYWLSEPDNGISDAFNKGIALASGKLIGILNADDWYEPEAVSRVVAVYKPHTVIHGNLQYWTQEGKAGMLVTPDATLLPKEMTINHPTVFIDRDIYLKYGVFSTNYKMAMDYHLLLRLFVANVPFIHIDKTIANMRLGGTSANWSDSYLEIKKAKDELIGPSYKNNLFYYWQVLRRHASETLSDSSFSFINTLYRKYFSSMKKV